MQPDWFVPVEVKRWPANMARRDPVQLHVSGLTCCVGREYAGHLVRSLPVWLSTLDRLCVVTTPDDGITANIVANAARRRSSCELVLARTPVFSLHGAHFNKGAALCVGYACLRPEDWVLHFDADVLPPNNWLHLAESRLRDGCLHGVNRFSEDGFRLDELPLYPYGYFHLWHALDPLAHRWPLFEPWHAHAGNYDAEFADLWPAEQRVDLGFPVIHLGRPRENWFGPDADPALMGKLHEDGLFETRLSSRDPGRRLGTPEPVVSLTLCGCDKNPAWCLDVIHRLSGYGPFAVSAHQASRAETGRTVTPDSLSPLALAMLIEEELCQPPNVR